MKKINKQINRKKTQEWKTIEKQKRKNKKGKTLKKKSYLSTLAAVHTHLRTLALDAAPHAEGRPEVGTPLLPQGVPVLAQPTLCAGEERTRR